MRVLVVSDIHANRQALAAIDERCDACLFLGDAVDYGGHAPACLAWLRRHATASVRGNHDHAVAQRVSAVGGSRFRTLAAATRPGHVASLDADDFKFLARLPLTRRLTLGKANYFLVHATPRDPLDEHLGPDPEAWTALVDQIEAADDALTVDYVLAGHTHLPYVLPVGRATVVNPGSVGQPRDGDPRVSYAVIEAGEIKIHRREYDVEGAIDDLRSAGVTGDVLDFAVASLRNGKPPE
ncbi:MAG: metallophosphoesterase family protein [Planctomycetota bacterium]